MKESLRIWAARLLIGAVLAANLQAAVLFLAWPEAYAPAFELSGAPGEGLLRGLGLLFLMWNVPYAVAFSHPLRQRTALFEALAMQAIGFFGETLLLLTFPPGHPQLAESVGRFIVCDGIGLAALIIAAALLHNKN